MVAWTQRYRLHAGGGRPVAMMEEDLVTDIDEQFEQAAIDVKSLAERPDNETLLTLYALFKQGAEGDVSGDRPGFFDFVAAAKYDAWEQCKGMSQDEAKQHYIDLVRQLTG